MKLMLLFYVLLATWTSIATAQNNSTTDLVNIPDSAYQDQQLPVLIPTSSSDCVYDTDCPNYSQCIYEKCQCKYGGTNNTHGNDTSCYECRSRFNCPANARCIDHKCHCTYGGAVTDSTGKLSCPYQCDSDATCPLNAACESHKCTCKYGGDTYNALGKLIYCQNECINDDDCAEYSECSKRKKCACKYGLSYSSQDVPGGCDSNLATVVSIIVGVLFFLGCAIACILRRRHSIAKENAAKLWVHPPDVERSELEASEDKSVTRYGYQRVHSSSSGDADLSHPSTSSKESSQEEGITNNERQRAYSNAMNDNALRNQTSDLISLDGITSSSQSVYSYPSGHPEPHNQLLDKLPPHDGLTDVTSQPVLPGLQTQPPDQTPPDEGFTNPIYQLEYYYPTDCPPQTSQTANVPTSDGGISNPGYRPD